MAEVEATTIRICVGSPPDENAFILEYPSFSEGPPRFLIISKGSLSAGFLCNKFQLPLPVSEIHSAKLIPRSTWEELQKGLILTADEHKEFNLNTAEIEPLTTRTPVKREKAHLESPASTQIPYLSTWLWEPRIWKNPGTSLWAQLKDAEIRRVYITIPIDERANKPKDTHELKQFIREAKSRNVDVWAVEGDPHAVLPTEREKFLKRADAYNSYNQAASSQERLAGVQYDIEPYLITGFDLEPHIGYQAYLDTVSMLKEHLDMPINIVVPFWLASIELNGSPIMEQLSGVDELTVMDYRTNPREIEQFAEPFLEWGVKYHKPVFIALEAGPLPDQDQIVFHPAAQGEIWHIEWDNLHLLLQLKHPRPNPLGESFLLSHKRKLDSSRLTFNKNIRALIDLIPALHGQLGKWSSYQGITLHQYLEISRKGDSP